MRPGLAACALGVIAGSVVVVGATGGPAYACKCLEVERTVLAQRASAVFVGTAGARTTVGTEEVRYVVTVDRVYKGDVPPQVTVATAANPTACGMPGLPLETELLFITQVPATAGRTRPAPDEFQVNLCGGTTPVAGDIETEVEGVLGLPSEPEPLFGRDGDEPAQPRDDGASTADDAAPDDGLPWRVGLSGLGIVALVVLLGWLASRRRG